MAAKEDDPLAAQQQKEPENDTPSDEEKDIDKLDDDMENVDERDREDVNETPHPEISNDEMLFPVTLLPTFFSVIKMMKMEK